MDQSVDEEEDDAQDEESKSVPETPRDATEDLTPAPVGQLENLVGPKKKPQEAATRIRTYRA